MARAWRLAALVWAVTAPTTCKAAVEDSLQSASAACAFSIDGRKVDESQVATCITQAHDFMGRRGTIGQIIGQTNETLMVCGAIGNDRLTSVGCEIMANLAWHLLGKALFFAAICLGKDVAADVDSVATCGALALQLADAVTQRLYREAVLANASPLGSKTVQKLLAIYQSFPAMDSFTSRQGIERLNLLWSSCLSVVDALSEEPRILMFQVNQYAWLYDSLKAGTVVQTQWGGVDKWDQVGANDARSVHHLEVAAALPPAYILTDDYGMRWDIGILRLKELHKRLGYPSQVVVVEIGVFAAHFSKFILDACPWVHLVGVDPYIGRDGTFPGTYSETIDPNVALATAALTFQEYPNRALLLDTTSEEAAPAVPDRSVDAIFIDGCHLYECVKSDMEIWLPKLKGAGSLVFGHDFSPQWPGVVRAVHEARIGGKEVFLAMDWMYWWWSDS